MKSRKEKFRRSVYSKVTQTNLTSKRFCDTGWSGVHEVLDILFVAADKYGIDLNIVQTNYVKDERGNLIRKVWRLVYTEHEGGEEWVCEVCGNGCGTVDDPLKCYDVTLSL